MLAAIGKYLAAIALCTAVGFAAGYVLMGMFGY